MKYVPYLVLRGKTAPRTNAESVRKPTDLVHGSHDDLGGFDSPDFPRLLLQIKLPRALVSLLGTAGRGTHLVLKPVKLQAN